MRKVWPHQPHMSEGCKVVYKKVGSALKYSAKGIASATNQ